MMGTRVVSFELPESTFYRLTRVRSINGKQPSIGDGNSVTGLLLTNPVKLDQRCVVDSVSTSPVKRIELDDNNPKAIIFYTHNSIYHLEQL